MTGPRFSFVNIAVWSFWEDRLLLGRSGTWVKICDLSEGKNVMINVPKAVEDQTSIVQLGLRFDGEWLYIAIPGYNDRIFVYHCTFNGTFWQAELIGKVYQGGS